MKMIMMMMMVVVVVVASHIKRTSSPPLGMYFLWSLIVIYYINFVKVVIKGLILFFFH